MRFGQMNIAQTVIFVTYTSRVTHCKHLHDSNLTTFALWRDFLVVGEEKPKLTFYKRRIEKVKGKNRQFYDMHKEIELSVGPVTSCVVQYDKLFVSVFQHVKCVDLKRMKLFKSRFNKSFFNLGEVSMMAETKLLSNNFLIVVSKSKIPIMFVDLNLFRSEDFSF